MRGLGEELVKPRGVAAADRRGDVLRGVAQVDGVDLGGAGSAEQAGAEREDTPAVGGGAFGEDADDALRVGFDEGGERDELGVVLGDDSRGREGKEDGA